MKNRVLDGIIGICIADALGVPVEFNGGLYHFERLKSRNFDKLLEE